MPRALQRALRQSFGNLKELRVMSVSGKGMCVVLQYVYHHCFQTPLDLVSKNLADTVRLSSQGFVVSPCFPLPSLP